MGKLFWSQWARLIALSAGIFEIIGGIFGIFYRLTSCKVLFSIFNPLILKFNYIAIFCIIFGLTVLAIEYPLPQLKDSSVAKSFIIRIFLYFFWGFLSTINYQNTNPGLYLMITSIMYAIALAKGESNEEMSPSLSYTKPESVT